jgi:hypothetical protein
MNELTVKTNELVLPKISWNEKEVADAVTELVKKYQGLEFDEEQLPIAKKDLASIRKVKKNLNSEKIKVKKAWNKNYTEFETDIKTYMHDIDVVINDIDTQVKTYEHAIKNARANEIKALEEYQAIKDYVVFDEKWLLKKWTNDLLIIEFNELQEQIDRGIKSIKLTATSHDLDVERYLEMFKTQELDLVLNRIVEDAQLVKPTKKVETPIDVSDEKVLTLKRNIIGTKTQLNMLADYAKQIGIKIEKE